MLFMNIRSRIFVIGLIFLCLAVSPVFAQDISIDVELTAKKVSLGSTLQLTVTVNGSNDIDQIQLPKIEEVDVQYLGPSTRVSIVNGQYSSSKTFTYSLLPRKEGQFQIPSFNIMVAGKSYIVDPLMITVVSNNNGGPSQGRQTRLEDKIFLVLEPSKREVYLNQRVDVKVRLFVTGLSANDVQYPKFDNVGFSVGEYQQPKQYQQVVNGIRYGIVEFNTEVYPTRTGELNLGPARTSCNLLVERTGGRNNMFDDDFFNSFFGRQERRPITLASEAMTINVLPFPEEGKPEDFSGAVGQFDFNVSVSPSGVKEGDPITFRTTVLGKGNLTAIQMPSLSSGEDFKLYDPQVFEKGDIKKTEQVIIPRSEEIKEVPQIRFSYFDPELRKYQTIKKGPFPITVTKLEKGDEFKVIGLEGEIRMVEPETLGEDIIFIKRKPGRLQGTGEAMYKRGSFYGVICVCAALWLAGFVYYKRTDRIRTDSVYARRLQAPRQAKQGLAQARKLIAARKGEEFYDVVFKTIQQYLGNKLHLSSGAVTFETVHSYLSENNVEQKVIDDIKLTYEECDMIRYALADISEENMNASYQRLAQAIDHLERFLK